LTSFILKEVASLALLQFRVGDGDQDRALPSIQMPTADILADDVGDDRRQRRKRSQTDQAGLQVAAKTRHG
jgi:hypothetical protein